MIEEAFGITIEADEFEQQASKRLKNEYERDGVLTDEALEELRKALPEVPAGYLRPGLKKIEAPSVLNVAVFVHLVQRKLAGKSREVNSA